MAEDVRKEAHELYLMMRTLWSHFGHRINRMLAGGGLNVPQYSALVALDQVGEATMSELSRRLRVTMGASTNIVDKLIRSGYVSRERSTEDRRVVRVKLEDKGREALGGIVEEAVGFMSQVLAKMPPEERKRFIADYQRMLDIALEGNAASDS